jgi:hypothetical protein
VVSADGGGGREGGGMSESDKVPVNLRLPRETALRLKVHALAENRAAADVVAELIDKYVTRYEIVRSDRDRKGADPAP